jgi:chromosome segregation ATPase
VSLADKGRKVIQLEGEVDAFFNEKQELVHQATVESEARAEEVAALRVELASVRAAHAEIEGNVSDLEGSLQKTLSENRSLIAQATAEGEARAKEVDERDREMTAIRGALEAARLSVSEQEHKVLQLKGDVDVLSNEKHELEKKAAAESKAGAEEFAALKGELASARAAHAELPGVASNMERSFQMLSSENQSLKAQAIAESKARAKEVADKKEQILALKREVEYFAKDANSAQTRKSDGEVRRLTQQLGEEKEKAAQKDLCIRELQARIQELDSKLALAQISVKRLWKIDLEKDQEARALRQQLGDHQRDHQLAKEETLEVAFLDNTARPHVKGDQCEQVWVKGDHYHASKRCCDLQPTGRETISTMVRTHAEEDGKRPCQNCAQGTSPDVGYFLPLMY